MNNCLRIWSLAVLSNGQVAKHPAGVVLAKKHEAKRPLYPMPVEPQEAAKPFATNASSPQNTSTSDDAEKVRVEVHYETRCPYCAELLAGELQDLWNQLRDRVDLKLVPAGNVMAVPTEDISDGYKFFHPETANMDYVFVCQHDSEECLGNAIQTCVINLTTPELYVPYVSCMESAAANGAGIEKCSYECLPPTGLAPKTVKKCVESKENNLRMYENVMLKTKRNVTGVPWVVIEGERDDSEDGFLFALCSHFEPLNYSVPDVCADELKRVHDKKRYGGPLGFLPRVWDAIFR